VTPVEFLEKLYSS